MSNHRHGGNHLHSLLYQPRKGRAMLPRMMIIIIIIMTTIESSSIMKYMTFHDGRARQSCVMGFVCLSVPHATSTRLPSLACAVQCWRHPSPCARIRLRRSVRRRCWTGVIGCPMMTRRDVSIHVAGRQNQLTSNRRTERHSSCQFDQTLGKSMDKAMSSGG